MRSRATSRFSTAVISIGVCVLVAGCARGSATSTPSGPPAHDQQAVVAYLTAFGFTCEEAPAPIFHCDRGKETIDVYPLEGIPTGHVTPEVATGLGVCDQGESPAYAGYRLIGEWPPCNK